MNLSNKPVSSTTPFHDNDHQQPAVQQNTLKSMTPPSPTQKKGSANYDDPPSNRQLLPVLVCLLTFATVLSVLIIYMDTTEIRHQQFRLNMTRDYDLVGVTQDDPQLISYVRDIYMRRYANSLYSAAPPQQLHHQPWDYRGRRELTPRMAQFVVDELLDGKQGGVFVQSMTGAANERLMTAQWLAGGAAWTGVIVEPDLRKYFEYHREMAAHGKGVDVVHACVSPNEYPKEVDWRSEGATTTMNGGDVQSDEVKIDSLLGGGGGYEGDEDAGMGEAGRVKCFSLFTILLATNRTRVDILSLGCRGGQQLQVLQTVPFDRVRVRVISLHFGHGEDDKPQLMGNVTRFLYGKGYEFVRKMEHNYFYQAIERVAGKERRHQERVEGKREEEEN